MSNRLNYFSFDLFTHGRSEGFDCNNENFLISEHVLQVFEVFLFCYHNFFNGGKVVLAGHAYGAQLGVLLLRYENVRGRIDGMLLLSPTLDYESMSRWLYLNHLSSEEKSALELRGLVNVPHDGENYLFPIDRDFVKDAIRNNFSLW